HLAEELLIGLLEGPLELRGYRLAPLAHRAHLDAQLHRLAKLLLLFRRALLHLCRRQRVDLLEDPRHGWKEGGSSLRQLRHYLPRVAAEVGDRGAQIERAQL